MRLDAAVLSGSDDTFMTPKRQSGEVGENLDRMSARRTTSCVAEARGIPSLALFHFQLPTAHDDG